MDDREERRLRLLAAIAAAEAAGFEATAQTLKNLLDTETRNDDAPDEGSRLGPRRSEPDE